MRTRSPSNAAGHYAQATEPRQERDEAAELVGRNPHLAGHDGTPSEPRADMAPAMAAALGAPTDRPLSVDELQSVVDGRRVDDQAIPQAPQARRFSGNDADGKQRVKFLDLTLSPDISWSVAHANA